MFRSSKLIQSAVSLMAAACSMVSVSVWADDAKQVAVPVLHVFVPFGFDSNDNSEVIVKAYLPNLCYRAPSALSTVTGQDVQIDLTAWLVPGRVCAMVAVPFVQDVSLGMVNPGDYKVSVNANASPANQGQLSVAFAKTASTDDYIYANVESVERVPGTRQILLKGTNPSDCFTFKQIKTYSNGTDTYSVLPILKQTKPTCDSIPTPFTYKFDVPTTLTESELLLHVRRMNGRSVNELFENN